MSADDELDPEAQRLVELARDARSPTDEQRERAFQALMATVGGGAAVGAAKVAAAKTVAKSSLAWLKWAVPALIAGSAGVGAYLWKTPPAPTPAPVVVPSAVVAAPAIAPTPDPIAPPAASSAVPTVKSAPAAAIRPASSDDLAADIGLLHEALAASRAGNAAKALDLARQHQSRYPNSRLRIERDAIEVRSLCSLGRTAEARKIANRVRAQAPSSPVSAALAETCAGK